MNLKRKAKAIVEKPKKKTKENKDKDDTKDEQVSKILKLVMEEISKKKKKEIEVVKRKKKKKKDVEGKFPILRVRNTPKSLYEAMNNLTVNQKKRLKEIGFGKVEKMMVDAIPGKIAYYVLKNFDHEKMRINLENGSFIPITEDAIHEMLGIPIGGLNLKSLPFDANLKKSWMSQFKKGVLRGGDVKDQIITSKVADFTFVLNFLALMVNTMGLTDKMGGLDVDFIGHLNEEVTIQSINWCNFILEIMKVGKSKWNNEPEENFSGPITLLMVSFKALDIIYKCIKCIQSLLMFKNCIHM